MAASRNRMIAALDVGTSKTCCFIAELDESDTPRITGIAHHVSRGVRAGAIVDMEAAEAAIRGAVDAAERMAGETIQEVYVNISAGAPSSETVAVEVSTAGHEIGEEDIRHVLDYGRSQKSAEERHLLHSLPVGYAVDGVTGVREPRGLFGDRLSVDMHFVTTALGPARNLESAIQRGHLDVGGMVVSPYASGLACLVDDEFAMGATCIDLGAGTTSMAVFCEGSLIFADVVPFGGANVTSDIARGLLAPLADAERIKTLHGCAIAGPSDDHAIVRVPQIGEENSDGGQQIKRSMLIGIIQPRLQEIFEMVRERLDMSGVDRLAGRGVVLTGGGAQMTGVRELAAQVLGRHVRIGRPNALAGLAEATSGPAFSTCAGLLLFAKREAAARAEAIDARTLASGVWRLGKVGRWLRENF